MSSDLERFEERFVWKPGDVVIHPPKCEGCQANLSGDEAIPGLCAACADTIDRDTEALLERQHFGDDLL